MSNFCGRRVARAAIPFALVAVVGVQLLGPVAAQAAATMHEYDLPAGGSPYHAIAGDPKSGDVFFGGFQTPSVDAVGRITPKGVVTWYPTGFIGVEGWPGNGMAMHDGDPWFGVVNTNWVGYLHFNGDGTTSVGHFLMQGQVQALWSPDPATGPIFLAEQNHIGELAFTDPNKPTEPTITECSLLGEMGADDITGDPVSHKLFISDGNDIGVLGDSIGGGTCAVDSVAVPTQNAVAGGLTVGGDGNVWFGEFHNASVGSVSESLTGFHEYPTGGDPGDGATGPDGNVYFTDIVDSRILQVMPDGSFNSYFTLTGDASPSVIALGPDNALWFPEITAKAIGQLVVTLPTKTTISSADASATYGEDGDITATVKSVPPGSVPTGDVEFDVNGAPFETQPLNEHGKATMPIADLEVGSYTITAKYLGDESFTPSTSKHLLQTVDPADTSVDLASSKNPAPKGTKITFTATVHPVPPGGGTPTGTVTFKIDGVPQPPVSLTDGSAKLKIKTLRKGSHTIVAVYSGSIDYNSSTSPPLTQVIT